MQEALQLHQDGVVEGLEVMRLLATVQELAQQEVEGEVPLEVVAYQEVEAMV